MAQQNSARWFNFILGAWLFVSAFIWPHTRAQFNNAWTVGIASAIIALIAMRTPVARYINAALAVWLFISAWVLPLSVGGTFWNDIFVGIAMFIAALTPNRAGRLGPAAAHSR